MLLFNSITDVINYLKTNLDDTDITLNKGASKNQIEAVENAYNIKLPDDIRQFYEFADGFISEEDQFRIIDLNEIITDRRDGNELHFAEYLTYCDMWGLKVEPDDHNRYSITYPYKGDIILTNSFTEFLRRFLTGGVFETGGLYDWRDKIIKLQN
ncbi:SMI1/KNR4 family protein [Mucilaginibacter ginsenosidivorax]|uniref:SMI1/KNR4 family protein n=1 Tax=Mucilaginibacter ginsenosidivorax TaxID=862126 RepID=A0A5B8W1L5_9SPHI|nr:SMI1/KNR4 family protein [Mucilaginibacter ginsenosidivorax]QEC77593.1 SMI1/KNR4 family protein [Mucilaginibacter ginsenosidivorax]